MALFVPDNYCQECYDIGRAIEKLNDYLRLHYWEVCDPEATRHLYKVICSQVIKFCNLDADEETEEEHLFVRYSQDKMNFLHNYIDRKTEQFVQRDKIRELLHSILDRLNDFNIWLESSLGQDRNWWRVYEIFNTSVRQVFWTRSELMNFIPDDDNDDDQTVQQP